MNHTFTRTKLESVSKDRKPGYLAEVLRCAIKTTDTHVEISDRDFFRIRKEYAVKEEAPAPPEQPGPGTELKKLLATIGIHASPTCKCNAMAKKMNEWGPDESLKHMEEIIDVMEETAKKRKLPFLRTAAKVMVRAAIWKARKKHG